MQHERTENDKRQPHEGASVVEYGLVLSLLILALMSGLEAVGMVPEQPAHIVQQADLLKLNGSTFNSHTQ